MLITLYLVAGSALLFRAVRLYVSAISEAANVILAQSMPTGTKPYPDGE